MTSLPTRHGGKNRENGNGVVGSGLGGIKADTFATSHIAARMVNTKVREKEVEREREREREQ